MIFYQTYTFCSLQQCYKVFLKANYDASVVLAVKLSCVRMKHTAVGSLRLKTVNKIGR